MHIYVLLLFWTVLPSVDSQCSPEVDCNGHGTCEDLVNDYRCECIDGYVGKDCESNENIDSLLHYNGFLKMMKLANGMKFDLALFQVSHILC